ncbi:MAG: hypothetical protein PWQ30_1068 [Euryarchaeota archaeon]|nr:hypothetical protein [Euryarchaeota archaeon]
MADLTITVPEDIVQALRPPPDTVAAELQRELAVALYQRGILSSGKAAALAGMTRWEWEEHSGHGRSPGITPTRTSTRTSPMPLAVSSSILPRPAQPASIAP